MLHHGRSHVTSLEADHFQGFSMDTTGEGDRDLVALQHGKGHVGVEDGSHAQDEHFTSHAMVLKRTAGGEGLYNTAGTISEMKTRGHAAADLDKTKAKSYDHFAAGGGTQMAQDAPDSTDLRASAKLRHDPSLYSKAHGGLGTDHFKGGTMAMDTTALPPKHKLTKHAGQHGDNEHSFDHFGGGSAMTMANQSASLELLSVGGAGNQHKHHVGAHVVTEDHFDHGGMAMAGDGEQEEALLDQRGGAIVSHHPARQHQIDAAAYAKGGLEDVYAAHAAAHQHAHHSDDHFGSHSMGLAKSAQSGLISVGGARVGGVAKVGMHTGAAEHSFDHFGAGSDMNLGSCESAGHSGIFSTDGVELKAERRHVVGAHGDKRTEDHFAGSGMVMSAEYGKEGTELRGANGAILETMHHDKQHDSQVSHFSGGSFEARELTNAADYKRIHKNRHFVSFYT